MKNKIIMTILFIAFIASGFLFLKDQKQDDHSAVNESSNQVKIKIAACPTCFEMAKKLDLEKYQIIPTASTAESVELIKNQQADLILAGRTLKPNEPPMEEIIIGEGYSFISSNEFSTYTDELKNYIIYTDLDIGLIKDNFLIDKIEKVKDVYQYLNKGVIITSWENTDYARAKTVHILEVNGERLKLSRRPAIYCAKKCGEEIKQLASLLK